MSSGLVDIGLDTADSLTRRGKAPHLKNKKKNRPIFFELLSLVQRNNSEASILLSIREKSAVVQSNAGGLF